MVINNTNFLNVSYYNNSVGYVNTNIDMAQVIRDNCQHYSNFLTNTIILCAVLFIIVEILTHIKFNEKITPYILEFKDWVYTFFGLFLCYEGYFFLTNIISETARIIMDWVLKTFAVCLILLMIYTIWKRITTGQ